MKTELNDRVLWHDGTNQVKPEMVPDLFALGVSQDKIIVRELTEDITIFNQMADDPIETAKTENAPFDLSWNIPDEFKVLDLSAHLQQRMKETGKDSEEYQTRVKNELAHIRSYEIEALIKTLIFVVHRLKSEGKVWGVGRGSSCASLVLHLIGVHEVDPIKYNIPLTEFFHDN